MNADSFVSKIEDKSAVVGVVGLGYVGLPLAMEFVRKGFRVIGFDIDSDKPETLARGESYISHIPSSEVAVVVQSGLLEATTDFSRCSEADALLICVPTPLGPNKTPDLSYVESTADSIAPYIRAGQLVSLESTTYPGTTRDVLIPRLQIAELKAGTDFWVAYSPEREDPGNPDFSTSKIPKVIGGLDSDSLRVANALYGAIVTATVPVSSLETAEAVKLTENIFRGINIALVNELKLIYTTLGIDVWEVIDSAATKPFGYMPFYPGPGLGGHCIPIDPFYLSWKAEQAGISTRFIELAGEINTSMPGYVVDRLAEALSESNTDLAGAKVLVLGAAYKKNVGDARESPGLALINLLRKRDVDVDYSDPYIPYLPKVRKYDLAMESITLTPDIVAGYDAVLIATDHDVYDYALLAEHAKLVVDTRNAMSRVADPRNVVRKA